LRRRWFLRAKRNCNHTADHNCARWKTIIMQIEHHGTREQWRSNA